MEWLHQHLLNACSVAPDWKLKKNAGKDLVSCQKSEGTFVYLQDLDQLSFLFFSQFSVFFSQNKLVPSNARCNHAGTRKLTRLQNQKKISSNWFGFVMIWSSRCWCSQSINKISTDKLSQVTWL